MVFINESLSTAYVLAQSIDNITGSLYISLLALMIIFVAFCLSFRMPIILASIVILPMGLVFMAYSGDIIPYVGMLLLFLGGGIAELMSNRFT